MPHPIRPLTGLLAVLTAACLLSACQKDPVPASSAAPPASSGATAPESSAGNGYTAPDGRFSLKLPDGWAVTDEEEAFIFQAPPRDGETDKRPEGLVIAEDPSDKIGHYTPERIEASIAGDYAGFQRLDGGELTIGGRQAMFLQYQYDSGGESFVGALYLVDGGSSLFTLTYTVRDLSMSGAVRESALSFVLS